MNFIFLRRREIISPRNAAAFYTYRRTGRYRNLSTPVLTERGTIRNSYCWGGVYVLRATPVIRLLRRGMSYPTLPSAYPCWVLNERLQTFCTRRLFLVAETRRLKPLNLLAPCPSITIEHVKTYEIRFRVPRVNMVFLNVRRV